MSQKLTCQKKEIKEIMSHKNRNVSKTKKSHKQKYHRI